MYFGTCMGAFFVYLLQFLIVYAKSLTSNISMDQYGMFMLFAQYLNSKWKLFIQVECLQRQFKSDWLPRNYQEKFPGD